jgi:hypothetical protein
VHLYLDLARPTRLVAFRAVRPALDEVAGRGPQAKRHGFFEWVVCVLHNLIGLAGGERGFAPFSLAKSVGVEPGIFGRRVPARRVWMGVAAFSELTDMRVVAVPACSAVVVATPSTYE